MQYFVVGEVSSGAVVHGIGMTIISNCHFEVCIGNVKWMVASRSDGELLRETIFQLEHHHVITFEPSIVEAPDSQGVLIRAIDDYLSALFVTTELVCSTLGLMSVF